MSEEGVECEARDDVCDVEEELGREEDVGWLVRASVIYVVARFSKGDDYKEGKEIIRHAQSAPPIVKLGGVISTEACAQIV